MLFQKTLHNKSGTKYRISDAITNKSCIDDQCVNCTFIIYENVPVLILLQRNFRSPETFVEQCIMKINLTFRMCSSQSSSYSTMYNLKWS